MANPPVMIAPAGEGRSFPWAPLSQSDDEDDDGGGSIASAQAGDGEEVEEEEEGEEEGADDDEDGLSVGVEEVVPLASDESGAEDDDEAEEGEEEDDDDGDDDWAEDEAADDGSSGDDEEDDYAAKAAAKPPAQRRGVRGKSVPAHAKRSKGTLTAKAAAKAAKRPAAPERRPPARRHGAAYSSLAQLPPVPPGSGLLQDAINGVAVPPKVTEDTLIAVYTSESALRSCWVQPLPPAGEAATAMALQRAASLSIPTALSRQLQVETPSFRVVQDTPRPAVRSPWTCERRTGATKATDAFRPRFSSFRRSVSQAMRGAAGEVEPTDDEIYEQRHRRPEYNEKRIVRRDRERAQFEVRAHAPSTASLAPRH